MSFTNLKYHVVFSTKNRRPLLRAGVRPRLLQYVGGIVRSLDCVLVKADGTDDHLHLLVGVHPSVPLAGFMRDLKANSSRWVHQTFPDMADFAWQDEYSAFTVSHSRVPAVVAYIQGQGEHHRKVTFEQELRLLLRRHGVEFDDMHLLR